jgi:hypothetical protein
MFLFQVAGPVRRPSPDNETVVPDADTPVAVEHPSHAVEHFFGANPRQPCVATSMGAISVASLCK